MRIIFNVPDTCLSVNSSIGVPLYNESSEYQEKVGMVIGVQAVGNTNLLQVEAQIEERYAGRIAAMLGSGTIMFGDMNG